MENRLGVQAGRRAPPPVRKRGMARGAGGSGPRSPPHPSPFQGEGVPRRPLGANRDTQFADRPRIVTGARIGRVMLWMSGVLLSFSVMAVSIRALARTFHVFEILAMRSAGGLAVLLALACARPALRVSLPPPRT